MRQAPVNRDKPELNRPPPPNIPAASNKPTAPNITDTTVAEDHPVTQEKVGLSFSDILVIMILCTLEIVQVAIEFLKNRTINREVESYSTAIVTVIVVVWIGILGDLYGRFKHYVLIAFLGVYFFCTPIVGLLFGASSLLKWTAIGWTASNPLRLWYIFNQKFPLPISHTHLIVSISQFLTGLAEWGSFQELVAHKWVKIGWILLFVISVGLVLLTFFMKRFINRSADSYTSVEEIYKSTDALDSFKRRNSKTNILFFLALIYPTFMMYVMKETVDFGVYYLGYGVNLHYTLYRLDLLVSLIVIALMEILMWLLKRFQNEFFDLVLIAQSHILFIVVLVILQLTFKEMTVQNETLPRKTAGVVRLSHYQLGLLVIYDGVVQETNIMEHSTVVYINGAGMIPVKVVSLLNAEVLAEGAVYVEQNRRSHYTINHGQLVRKYGLEEIKSFDGVQFYVVNDLPNCDQYPVNESANEPRYLNINGNCHPILIKIEFPSGAPTISFAPPLPNVTSEMYYFYESFNYSYAHFPGFYQEYKPHHIAFLRINLPEPIEDEIVINSHYDINNYRCPEKILVPPIVLFGIALGIGRVGYMHFLWIQSPFQYRTLIISSYVLVEYVSVWITRMNLVNFEKELVTTLLVLQCLVTLWHLVFMAIYQVLVVHLWTERETNQKDVRQF